MSASKPEFHLRRVVIENLGDSLRRIRLGDEPNIEVIDRRQLLAMFSSFLVPASQGRAHARGRIGASADANARSPRTATEAPDDAGFSTPQSREGQAKSSSEGARFRVAAHKEAITALMVSRDGAWLATAASDRTVKSWEMPNGFLRGRSGIQGRRVRALAFPPRGRIWAVHVFEKSIVIDTIPSGPVPRSFRGEHEFDTLASMPTDGASLALSTTEGLLQTWDANTEKLASESKPPVRLAALAYSPDGQVFATIDMNRSLSVRAGAEKTPHLIPGMRAITALAVSNRPTTSAYAVGPEIHVESLDSGKPSFRLPGEHRLAVTALAFSPDSKYLVSGDAEGVVIIWDLAKRVLLAQLFDPMVSGGDATAFRSFDLTGRLIIQTLPCGSPTPVGATCICNCVPGVATRLALEFQRRVEIERQIQYAEYQRQQAYLRLMWQSMTFIPSFTTSSSTTTRCVCLAIPVR